jgi:hypothetical protein
MSKCQKNEVWNRGHQKWLGTILILLDSYTAAKPISDSASTPSNIVLTAVYSCYKIQYCTQLCIIA